jgi:tRNA A-37 threonylcarbamoyl transferase component Bud32
VTEAPRTAEELLRRGEPGEAARLFLEAGQIGRALDALEAAGRFEEAAQLALDAEDAERALRLSARQNLPRLLSAAESALLLRHGRTPGDVAQLLLQLGRHARAAELLAASGDRLGAARLFEQVGRRERAAEELCAAGQGAPAGHLWERHLAEHPEDVRSRLALARLLLESGRERDAVAHAQAALHVEPALSEALELAASGLERMGLRHAADALRDRLKASTPAPGSEATEGIPAGTLAAGGPSEGLGRVGRYELLEVLGHGASATVIRAQDRWSGRTVALKRMRADLEESPEALRRFLLEARLASRLRHPNIVAVLDADERGRMLALELMEGGTLRDRMDAGPVPMPEARRWILEALEGIACAHFEGIVHRDLKPSNLLLTRGGVLEIADFGVAHVLDSSWTRSGTVVGTYGYLAPEQLLGQPAQPATDLYALGVVLYELVAGRPPFSGRDLVQEHLDTPPPWPARAGRRVSRTLGEAILRLLAKEPLDRFDGSARAAAEALADADWELEPADPAEEPCGPAEEPAAPEPVAAAEEEAPFAAERYRLVEESRDALGTWRRSEDRWLGRTVMERRYVEAERASPVLSRLVSEPGGRLPVLVRCAAERGEATWVEPELPPASAEELSPLVEELGRLGLVPAPDLDALRPHAGRLPDGTAVLCSLDPLIPS